MPRRRPVHARSIIAVSLLLSATALTAVRASANDRDGRDVVDGLPNADVCEKLGFPRDRADGDGYRFAPQKQALGGTFRSAAPTLSMEAAPPPSPAHPAP